MIQTSTSQLSKIRYYDLDWLRVLAFSILFFEHAAEIFVDWKYWIKNAETSTSLTYFIAFFLPWRMPLIFLISGVATGLICRRLTMPAFIKERAWRLLVPLVFAIFVIIPPQIYLIRKFAGQPLGLGDFYSSILNLDLHWATKGNIHFLHLWYLAFLFIYVLIMLPFLKLLTTSFGARALSKLSMLISRPLVLFLLGTLITLPFYFIPIYHGDTFKAIFVYYFPFFVIGLLFWANPLIRESVRQYAPFATALALVLSANLYAMASQNHDPQYYFLSLVDPITLPVYVLKSFNQWFWVLTISGWAMRLCKTGSHTLTLVNQAVYPFYILHQTVILIIGYMLLPVSASISIKLGIVVLASFFSILLFYQFLILPAKGLRIVFGVKPAPEPEKRRPKAELSEVLVEG